MFWSGHRPFVSCVIPLSLRFLMTLFPISPIAQPLEPPEAGASSSRLRLIDDGLDTSHWPCGTGCADRCIHVITLCPAVSLSLHLFSTSYSRYGGTQQGEIAGNLAGAAAFNNMGADAMAPGAGSGHRLAPLAPQTPPPFLRLYETYLLPACTSVY